MATVYPPETNDGVMTSWVPLTATFTPSIGCESKFRLNGPSLVAYDPGYGLDIDPKVKCAPPAVTTWWEQGRLGKGSDAGHTAASLGPMTCPNAWSTVATSVRDTSTLAMCCPPDYYLARGVPGSVAGDCLSDVTSGAVLIFASTPAGSSKAWSIATTTLTRRSTVGAIAVVGWNIAIETSATSSRTSTTSATTRSTTISSPSTLPDAPASSSGSSTAGPTSSDPAGSSPGTGSSGLSTGAAIGLGVGVGLGVVGIAALVATIYLIRRSRRRKAEAAATADTQPAVEIESVPGGYYQAPKPPEAYASHELAHEGPRTELPGMGHGYRPYELP